MLREISDTYMYFFKIMLHWQSKQLSSCVPLKKFWIQLSFSACTQYLFLIYHLCATLPMGGAHLFLLWSEVLPRLFCNKSKWPPLASELILLQRYSNQSLYVKIILVTKNILRVFYCIAPHNSLVGDTLS